MKVFVAIVLFVSVTSAHHTEKHSEQGHDDLEPQKPETEDDILPTSAELRHHTAPSDNKATAIPILVPYPTYRMQHYPIQPFHYVPAYTEYPLARQGLGGGFSGNLGPLNGGIGVGAGTGGAGGVLNVGFGNFGGVGANVGLANPLSSDPGYVQYLNQHYKPPIQYYYTDSQPIQVYPIPPEQIPTSPPRFQHQARTPPRGILIPVYY